MNGTPSEQEAAIARVNDEANGFRELLGYRLVEWEEGRAVIDMVLGERHMNRARVLHGGAIATLIDNVCGFSATYTPVNAAPRFCVTLSLTVSFTGQATTGTVRATGRIRGGGRKVVFASAEIHDEAGNLIGFGEGTFRYRSGSEKPLP